MDNEELQAIKQRADAATPGPWVARDGQVELGWNVTSRDLCVADLMTEDDAEFIAHARADIPALLDEIRQCYESWNAQTVDIAALIKQNNQLIAENERLRAQLAAQLAAVPVTSIRRIVEAASVLGRPLQLDMDAAQKWLEQQEVQP